MESNPKPKQSRINRPRAQAPAAPKVARKKKVADEAIADFLGAAPVEPAAVASLPVVPEELEPAAVIVELARPEPVREAPARKPTIEDFVVGFYVKVKKELEHRYEEKIAPLLARIPWIGRRFSGPRR